MLQVPAKVEAASPLPYISHPECINFQGVKSYSIFNGFLQSTKNNLFNECALRMPWRKNNRGNTWQDLDRRSKAPSHTISNVLMDILRGRSSKHKEDLVCNFTS